MNKRTEKILELIDEIGLWKTKELLGVSLTKLVKLADLKIHPGLAGEIIIEGINNETLPTMYKEFTIETNMDGVVYWEGKLNTGHFLPHVNEDISVMATPFWDNESYTPVESNWYSLTDSKKNTLIAEIYIPNSLNLPQINHIDGDIYNNSISMYPNYQSKPGV